MIKLFDEFCNFVDEITALRRYGEDVESIPWKVYNTTERNKLITDNYGQLPAEEMRDLDDSEVVSVKHCNGHIKAYVRYEREGV